MDSTSSNKSLFPIANLPYGVISTDDDPNPRCVVAYQDYAVVLKELEQAGLWKTVLSLPGQLFDNSNFNSFARLPTSLRKQFREKLKEYLLSTDPDSSDKIFVPLSKVRNHYPMETKNFSDFYCSYEHGKNCAAVFSGNVLPNWYMAPSVYNGRTSSLVVSGTPITRPSGVFSSSATTNPSDRSSPPAFQPETQFDFELEMGVFLSKPVPRGQRFTINDAKKHIFGFVLLNDWSARMIQFFEMAPLGPFHGKGSGTSISPWIIPIEALEEVAASPRHTPQEPSPLPHLAWQDDQRATYNIDISAKIIRDNKTYQITQSNMKELHWTPLQMVTHLGSAGEGLSTGDIFGTGTCSSARTNEKGEKIGLACLWERKLPHCKDLSTAPEKLAETLLLDGDEVVFEAWCKDPKTGEVLLGFGECRGKVLPAIGVDSVSS